MAFYTYDQNNSGGGFVSDNNVTFTIIIEAPSASEADTKAEEIGIYFDDDYEMDCPCCGTRWSRAWDSDGEETPTVCGKPVEDYQEGWAKPGQPYAYIYYANGDKVAHIKRDTPHD